MMNDGGDITVRTATARDVPGLQALWGGVFGDSPEAIGHFFNVYFSPALTAVIGAPGAPAAAAYVVPDGDLVLPDGTRLPCAMVYAVATDPAFRGLGYGAAVSRAAGRLAVDAGFPAAVLKPANAGLFDFYARHTDFRTFFHAYEFELTPDGSGSPALPTPESAAPADYRRIRNSLLAGSAYIDADERTLGYQRDLCRSSAGGLYALWENGRAVGCAIAERDDREVVFKELLVDDGRRLSDAAAALAALMGAASCRVRTPVPPRGTDAVPEPFGMLLPVSELNCHAIAHSATWYGPAFD